ncbi:MAG: hypothetical protein KDB00_17675 [Planctomycetales bacterium]|nr:hypothetical protein [Planctomycetales bacterium]
MKTARTKPHLISTRHAGVAVRIPLHLRSPLLAIAISIAASFSAAFAADSSLVDALRTVAQADGSAALDRAASEAAKQLQRLPSSQVTDVLAGFGNATQRGRNWLRAIAADVSDNGPFQSDSLLSFYNDRSNDPDARYVAFQLLTQNDSDGKADLLSNAQTDPSLPIRYLKIQSMIDQAAAVKESNPQESQRILREVIANGRSPQQLEKSARLLADRGVNVDLADELGMMRKFWICGPFDNTESKHFDTAYVPENRYIESGLPFSLDANGDPNPEQGKHAKVHWQRIESTDKLGMVNLNEPLANEKDAAAYVFAKFTVQDGESIPTAQTRIGCITANKVWINGRLVSSNEVYHSGTRIDQYVEQCALVHGENTVLIKVMQNAQTEAWAQDWQFQFRLTRLDGSAIKTVLVE